LKATFRSGKRPFSKETTSELAGTVKTGQLKIGVNMSGVDHPNQPVTGEKSTPVDAPVPSDCVPSNQHAFPTVWAERTGLWLLDGPLGTRLQELGFAVNRPGWSGRALVEAPELVLQIHQQYVQAGADLLTANTFRTYPANLAEWGAGNRARELTIRAVELAKQAAGTKAWVLGSQAPVGDCYAPEQVPSRQTLERQHQQMAEHLAEAGVDAVLLETHVNLQEVLLAGRAVRQSGLPLFVSVTSFDGRTLLDGSPLESFAEQVQSLEPLAVGVNCVPVERVPSCLAQLRKQYAGALQVYANAGDISPEGEWRQTLGGNVNEHADRAAQWVGQGVRLLGGCCGTRPALIAKFAEQLRPPSPPEDKADPGSNCESRIR